MLANHQFWSSLTLIGDCKSLVQAVHNPYPTDPTIIALQQAALELAVEKLLFVIRVHVHCNLPGNELADTQAKLGTSMTQPHVPADDTTLLAFFCCECCPPLLKNLRLKEVYTMALDERLEAEMTIADLRGLICFGRGHHSSPQMTSLDGAGQKGCNADYAERKKRQQKSFSGYGVRISWWTTSYHYQMGDSMDKLVCLPQA